MKKIFLSAAFFLFGAYILCAQTYPEPEFSNEVYYLKKDNNYSLARLEKGYSKLETKTKFGGMGGSENEYSIGGATSNVRLKSGTLLSFIISDGSTSAMGTASKTHSDSVMQASGIDPSVLKGMTNMMDPVNRLTLYKTESGNGERLVILQKNHGGLPFASKKIKSSEKYACSLKKIRDGYWEIVPDKTLPPGEYAFTMQDIMHGGAGQETFLFAFGVD